MPADSPSKTRPVKSEKRRAEIRRALPRQTVSVRSLLERREIVNTIVIFLGFFLLAGAVVVWSHQQPRGYVGQVMIDTRLKRVDFQVKDVTETEKRRADERAKAPRVYTLNRTYLDELEAALLGLPVALEGKATLAEINPEVREDFRLTEDALAAVQPFAREKQTTEEWRAWVEALVTQALIERPLVASRDWQVDVTRLTRPEFRLRSRTIRPLDRDVIELNTETGEIDRQRLAEVVERAGFPPPIRPIVLARLSSDPQPVFEFAAEATRLLQEERAAAVPDVMVEHRAGEIIYRRGDVLTPGQLQLLQIEQAEFLERAPLAVRLLQFAGLTGMTGLIAAVLCGYLLGFYPRVVRNPLRVLAVCGLVLVMLALTGSITAEAPQVLVGMTVAGALFLSMILAIAYDQRLAATVGVMYCGLATLAVGREVSFLIFLAVVCGATVAMLRELRNRNSLVRATVTAAVVSGVAALLYGVFRVPPVEGAWRQILGLAGWSVAASLGVGFLVLGLLPTIERIFGITTGMTLVELRDPSHPLLKQLQQRAPGTYTHSLTVANIAESAAEAVGANSLLAYVGALYHDVGKMNKPDYFVENQSGGPSRHAKLSPAMSLLVIVGHVKDGIELAKEYGLPRTLLHFIESHHGTTLVQYFYHAAKTRAEQEGDKVEEVEYRYPGPKPRTKEAAVLMIADACESACRAMETTNPAGIETLVRNLARKRLLDGQFDDCDLTLRELRLIEDSVVKSLRAIYHGRVSYPEAEREKDKTAEKTAERDRDRDRDRDREREPERPTGPAVKRPAATG